MTSEIRSDEVILRVFTCERKPEPNPVTKVVQFERKNKDKDGISINRLALVEPAWIYERFIPGQYMGLWQSTPANIFNAYLTKHHRHQYDPPNVRKKLDHIGEDGWPTLVGIASYFLARELNVADRFLGGGGGEDAEAAEGFIADAAAAQVELLD